MCVIPFWGIVCIALLGLSVCCCFVLQLVDYVYPFFLDCVYFFVCVRCPFVGLCVCPSVGLGVFRYFGIVCISLYGDVCIAYRVLRIAFYCVVCLPLFGGSVYCHCCDYVCCNFLDGVYYPLLHAVYFPFLHSHGLGVVICLFLTPALLSPFLAMCVLLFLLSITPFCWDVCIPFSG